jgi:hypothetical protein
MGQLYLPIADLPPLLASRDMCESPRMIATQVLTQPMNRVIRSQATGRFFVERESGAWVESPDSATKYERLATMVEACRRFNLEDVELVARSEWSNQ